jgi:GNAT superfamily N-acetyltransferase
MGGFIRFLVGNIQTDTIFRDATDDSCVRGFDVADMRSCVEIAAEVWPDVPENMTVKEIVKLLKAYVSDSLAMATWREVVCVSDEVVGVVSGMIENDLTFWGRIKTTLLRARIWLGFVLDGRRYAFARSSVLARSILTEMRLARARPKTDAEVTLLLVRSDHRGKGIGRLMMRRFLEEARAKNARIVTVYTTDPGCNWQFYEICGFKMVGSFDDSLVSHLQGVDTKALVFAIDLQPTT